MDAARALDHVAELEPGCSRRTVGKDRDHLVVAVAEVSGVGNVIQIQEAEHAENDGNRSEDQQQVLEHGAVCHGVLLDSTGFDRTDPYADSGCEFSAAVGARGL